MHTMEQCILWAWIYGWTKGPVRVWFMLLLDCVGSDQTEAFDAHCRTLPLSSVYSLLANNAQCQIPMMPMLSSVWMNIWRLVCLVALQNNLSNWDAESHCMGLEDLGRLITRLPKANRTNLPLSKHPPNQDWNIQLVWQHLRRCHNMSPPTTHF